MDAVNIINKMHAGSLTRSHCSARLRNGGEQTRAHSPIKNYRV